MASSRKPPRSEGAVLQELQQFLSAAGVGAGRHVTVALSGGLDSMVLLHQMRAVSAHLGLHLSAIHINHQLQPQASEWAEFCRQVCNKWAIPLQITPVSLVRQGGESLEAVARTARYQQFDALAGDVLVLAHHADDQAETVLLQLLRGAGVAGLAAMPAVQQRAGRLWLRPLLEQTRAELQRYAIQHGLRWVDDPSNLDRQYDRNFIRHEILPLLLQRFPACLQTLGRSARHMAEAQLLLNDMAVAEGALLPGGVLTLPVWRSLNPMHQHNLLRYWLKSAGGVVVSERLLRQIWQQLLLARADSQVRIELPGQMVLLRYREQAFLQVNRAVPAAGWQQSWPGGACWALPELGGQLLLQPGEGQGIRSNLCQPGHLTVRLRQGGERFQPFAGRPGKSLQHWFQELGIPPWQRSMLPLLYAGDMLLWVPGLGVACAAQAAAGEAGVLPQWRPTEPAATGS